MEKRYVVTIDFYLFAESDEQAIEKAKSFCEQEKESKDNCCSVVSIHENNFGSLNSRQINGL